MGLVVRGLVQLNLDIGLANGAGDGDGVGDGARGSWSLLSGHLMAKAAALGHVVNRCLSWPDHES